MTVLFGNNPRRRTVAQSDIELATLCADAAAHFSELPILHRGESAEIRRTGTPGLLIQRLLPSLNSITQRRKGVVDGSDRIRHDISIMLWNEIHRQGIASCHLAYDGFYVLVTEEKVPPVEVIVKAAMVGTPGRIYHGLLELTDRFGRPFAPNQRHAPYVRFDYRNPLRRADDEWLRDECLPLALADRLIDTARAERNALHAFEVIRRLLREYRLDVLDACFLYDATGEVLCYEISPDNLRIKDKGWYEDPDADAEFDKDLWRRGVEPTQLLAQWQALAVRLRERDGRRDGLG